MKKIYTHLLALMLPLLSVLPALAVTHVIIQDEGTFAPASFTCNVGDVIRWEWTSGSHNTVSTNIPEGAAAWSAALNQFDTEFEYTITVAGSYFYVCTFHQAAGMIGDFAAAGPVSVRPILKTAERDMTVGVEIGSGMVHVRLSEGEPGNASVKIYDLTGKLAAVIYDGIFGMEEKKLSYDASSLGRGIYFVRFEMGNKVITRKIMLE